MFVSQVVKTVVESIPNVSQIGTEVCHLVKQLLLRKAFNIFMDNYFSSINLFAYLRSQGFGTCGTVRTNSTKFPSILKEEKELKSLITVDQIRKAHEHLVKLCFLIENEYGPEKITPNLHMSLHLSQ